MLKYSFLIIYFLILSCQATTKELEDLKILNTKKTGIRNTVFSSALLQNYKQTAVSTTTELDLSSIADEYPFSSKELEQMESTRLSLEKEGMLTPEAKYTSVMNSAVLLGTPDIKPGQEFDEVESIDLGLPPLPKVASKQEKSEKRQRIIESRDNFYKNLAMEISKYSKLELENLRSNTTAAILVSEQLKEYIYQLPQEDKDLLLEGVANSVQLRILVLIEMRKRGIAF